MKKMFVVMVALVALAGFNAFAFHSGGVAECEGCHSMHSPTSPSFLLVGTTGSSTCLSCHDGPTLSSYHVSSVGAVDSAGVGLPTNRTPGGDFAWLRKSYTWSGGSSPGQAKGHNIIAPDYGYVAQTGETYGPGGTYPVANLGCQSCHDPHGKSRRLASGAVVATGAPIIASGSYATSPNPGVGEAVGIYRILYTGASPDEPGSADFTTTPVAVAPGTYNRTEAVSQTRVAYGGGTLTDSWGNWCGTCHGEFNSTDKTVHHPIDLALGTAIATKYNAYVSSGIMTGGAGATAYSTIVPFAEATTDYGILKTHAPNNYSYTNGPTSADAVTCLSCHRAHASGFDHMLRFYYAWEFTTFAGNYPGIDNPAMTSTRAPIQAGGRNMADFAAAYYDRPSSAFGPYSRVLCNKCHAQD